MVASNKPVYTGAAGRSEIFNLPNNVATDVHGGDADDYILAWGFNDLISGGLDEDIIEALSGDDIIFGDEISQGFEGASAGSLTAEADVILGGPGNDLIYGQSGFDYINGESGDDHIYGGVGNDFLQGGNGLDLIEGGDGDDIVWGGGTNNIPAGYAKTVNYTLNGITNVDVAGSQNSNFGSIGSGDTSTDILYGNAGNDTLNGGQGVDIMYGGLGNDIFFIDNVDDRAFEYAGQGIDTVRTTANAYEMQAEIEYGALEGPGILLVGNGLDNWLGGADGSNNTIFAQGGNDTVVAGVGADVIYGGAGNDNFFFRSIADAGDSIRDWNAGDRVFLQGSQFGMTPGGLTQGTNFVTAVGMAAPTAAVSTMIYSSGTGNLFWDPDGSGANGAVFVANFTGNPALAASDFLIV